MQDYKKKYFLFSQNEFSIPIFSKGWWLDAVCGKGKWDVILIEKKDKIQAALPYYKPSVRTICMPPLTQNMGIWIKPKPSIKYHKKISYEKDLVNQIIDIMPSFAYYSQNFHYHFDNWQPFFWRGFKQTTRYTYVIDGIKNHDIVFSNFSHAKRKNIKRAAQKVTVRFDLDKKSFYENHMLTLKKKGDKIQYAKDLFYNIYDATYANRSGRTIYAIDEEDNIHAALFVIWDKMSAYDLISTIDPDFRRSGAASLLVYEMIKYTSDFIDTFDFEGSMIEPVANSFRQFGAIPIPYSNIYKDQRSFFNKGLGITINSTKRLINKCF